MFGYSRDYRSTGRRESSGALAPQEAPAMPLAPSVQALVDGLTARQREIVDENVRDLDDQELDLAGLIDFLEERYWDEVDDNASLAIEFAGIAVALGAPLAVRS